MKPIEPNAMNQVHTALVEGLRDPKWEIAMTEDLITVGTYNNAAEAEIVHAALTEQDIPAFVEEELAATVLPGTTVKLQVPAPSVKKAQRVLERIEHLRIHRLPHSPAAPGDRLAMNALLLASFAVFLFPVLLLLQAAAIAMMGNSLADLLSIRVTLPLFVMPALFSLASAVLLCGQRWQGLELSAESRRSVHDAWFYNLIVLGTVLAGLLLVGLLGRF